MRAAVLKQFNVPLVLEETPDPVAEPGWVLLKVKACGLCGTDLKIASGDAFIAGKPGTSEA